MSVKRLQRVALFAQYKHKIPDIGNACSLKQKCNIIIIFSYETNLPSDLYVAT